MKVAYFDCFSGASGDMILGALLDAGLDFEFLKSELAKLSLSYYTLSRREVIKAGFKATHFIVDVEEHHHHHAHRHLGDIEKIISESGLSEEVKAKSVRIFRRLAEAEASVHNEPIEHVHFHEVGAVDSIVDIVGAAIGFTALGIEEVYCSPLHVGTGTVECAHGVLPVPAPATAELIKGVPSYATGVLGELLTPTGAAILTTLSSGFGPMSRMTVRNTGYGAGTRDLTIPNLLRVFLGDTEEAGVDWRTEQVAVLQTNIDDMNPQIYEHLMSGLLALGAFEVVLHPVQMKKNRPGMSTTVVCRPDLMQTLSEFLIRETTTIGLRWRLEYKLRAPYETLEVETGYGMIRCKIAKVGNSIINVTPEYEDCRRLALERGVPLKDVMEAARQTLRATGGWS